MESFLFIFHIWLRLSQSRFMSAITHNLKYAMLSLLTVPLAIALTNCTPKTSIPLRIGSNLWTGYETLYLARDLGFYNDKSIHLVDYPSGIAVFK